MLNLILAIAALAFLAFLNKIMKNALIVLLILVITQTAVLYGVGLLFHGIDTSFYLLLVCVDIVLNLAFLGDLMIFTSRALRLDR